MSARLVNSIKVLKFMMMWVFSANKGIISEHGNYSK